MPSLGADMESGELVDALPEKDPSHTAHEAADLIFHVLVGLEVAGVPVDDVFAQLRKRFGISGIDEKAARGANNAAKPATAPATKPVTKPPTKASIKKPASRPTPRPALKKPPAKPARKPAKKPAKKAAKKPTKKPTKKAGRRT